MSQIPLTIKIDADVKQDAQKLAKSLGLSLSSIVENKLRQAVRERRIVFEDELVPNAKTAKELKEMGDDIAVSRNIGKTFNTSKELEEHFKSL